MKPFVLLLLGALALCAQDRTAVVTGSVVNSATGVGVDGATVTLAPITKTGLVESSYQAVTGADGTFRISGVKPGEYMPVAQRPGYRPLLTFGASIHIGQDTPLLSLELIPPARLRG